MTVNSVKNLKKTRNCGRRTPSTTTSMGSATSGKGLVSSQKWAEMIMSWKAAKF